MLPLGAVRLVPPGGVYKPIFEDEVRLVRSLHEVRNKTGFPIKNERLALVGDTEMSPDATRLLLCAQQGCVERTPYNDSTEKPALSREATIFQKAWKSVDINAAEEVRSLPDFIAPGETRSDILERLAEQRRGRHEEALTSMSRELGCIGREMEPFVLEPGKFLLTKLMESDRKIELLLKKIESDTVLEGFSIEGLEELWNIIHQESLTRRKWIREMDESLKKVEWSRADKITDVLRKYTVILEKISFFLPADIHRFMNNEAMLINRALLANQRAIAKLFVNLMKSEMMMDLSHRLKWQDRVKDWKLIQKNCVIRRFREFMANEEIQNPPTVKTEIENVITDQILLSERRMELLQHLGELFPSTYTEDEIDEWYIYVVNLNENIDTHNAQCMKKIRTQYEMIQQKCLAEMELCKNNLLNLKLCTKEEAEEIVDSEFFQLTEKLQSRFEEELEHMDRDFKEVAKQNEQICRDLYSYFQEAMGLWDAHQHNLSQQEDELQKKLDECRRKQHILIQIMEDNLDIVLDKMRTASSEEKLKKYLKDALSSLDDFRAKYETFYKVLMDEVITYPEAILQELISYSTSVSQYFNVKEIFKQNLRGEIDFTFQDQELVEASEAERLVEQQAESIVQETEGKQKTDSCQQENEETSTAENEEIFAQETEETEGKEDEESISHGSEGTEHAGEGVSFTQATFNSGKGESSKIAIETFSTSSGNSYTVFGVEEAGKTDIPETYFTKYEKKESLPMYLKYVLIEETVFVELKKRIRLCFFEDLEKWFADAFSNSFVLVAVKKEDLDSELAQRLQLHQRRQENIETNIYNVRAVELLLHKECLESHCAEVVEALRKERAEFLKFCDQQNNISKNLHSQIRDMESVFISAPMTEKLASFNNSLRSELDNHLKVIQVSLRSYQNYLEEALGKLRDSNADFLEACRLFVEGGEFSSDEVKSFSQCLQEESKRIDSFERLIKADMKKMESRCLQQATELIKQSETKFRRLFTNRVFMEKIQQFLRNLQVQIKAEVVNSNLQAETINSYLKKLHQKIEACAHPTAEKEALTSEELCDFAQVLLKELKKRSQYLDCLLVKPVSLCDSENFSPLATDVTLQGPVAVAIRAECLRDENKVMLMGLDPDEFPVLNPSRMGKSALDDLSISFIKNLLEIQPSGKSTGLNLERKDRLPSLGAALLPTSKKNSRVSVSGESHRNSAAQIRRKSSFKQKKPTARRRKSNVLDLSDEKFQIFGEEPPESDTFKGIIMNILWTGNNSLLSLAEEFYKNQQQPQITMSEDLPETFERCAETLRQNLLSYQSQADDYYNSCLLAFQDQLTLFEKELPYVSQLAADILLREHEQKLSSSTAQIRHLFNKQMEEWENVKAVHKNQLHPSLGHPDNLLQLDALCQKEIKRQKDQADGINLNTKMLQACAAECAQNFVSALAAFTEKLLLELDESVTIDDIQVAKTDPPRQKTSTLIRRKQAELPLEISEVKHLIERGSRTWPGIPMTTLTDNSDYILCRETASVTTAKTTLGHVAAVEARDAVYKKYKYKLEQQFAQIKEENTAQLLTIQRWEDWWKRSIQKIKELYKARTEKISLMLTSASLKEAYPASVTWQKVLSSNLRLHYSPSSSSLESLLCRWRHYADTEDAVEAEIESCWEEEVALTSSLEDMISRKTLGSLVCLFVVAAFIWITFGNGKVHYLPYYLPCPEILKSVTIPFFSHPILQLHETTIHRREANPAFPPIILSAAKSAGSKASGCADSYTMAGPIIWEGTFNPEILDSAYRTPNLTVGVMAFAIGNKTFMPMYCVHNHASLQDTDSAPKVPGSMIYKVCGPLLGVAGKHFMKGYQVHCYIFTDNPETIPDVPLQPGRRFVIVRIKQYPSWQEISMHRMEAINKHIAEMSHQEVDCLFCLDIDVVFYNTWGPETLGDIVVAIHPGYFNVPRSQFPYERRSSAAYIPDGEGDFYNGGAVFGGLVEKVCEFTKTCHMTILTDKANGIMAAWQEESHLNRHFHSHKPSKVLSPEYLWDDRKPKPPEIHLIRFSAVDKNYKEIRD